MLNQSVRDWHNEVLVWYVGYSPTSTYQGAPLCRAQPYWISPNKSKLRCSLPCAEPVMAASSRSTCSRINGMMLLANSGPFVSEGDAVSSYIIKCVELRLLAYVLT